MGQLRRTATLPELQGDIGQLHRAPEVMKPAAKAHERQREGAADGEQRALEERELRVMYLLTSSC